MAKIKLPYIELQEIRGCLRELGRLNLPIPYEIGKNLRKVNAALRDPEEQMEELRKKYIEKDAEGDPIYYAVNKEGNIVVFDPKNRNDFPPGAPLQTFIDDKTKLKEFKKEAKVIEEDEFEVDFHEVKMSKLTKFLSEHNIPGILFEPLVDIIFFEDSGTHQESPRKEDKK